MKAVVNVILGFGTRGVSARGIRNGNSSTEERRRTQKFVLPCRAVWACSFCVLLCFLRMCFVISFARRTNGRAEVIEHDGEEASTSHAVERCQEPPSTTYRALNRLTLGGSRHLRRNDSRPRCAFVFAAQRQLHSPRSGRQNLAVGETHGTGSDAPLSRAAAT